MRNIKLTIEYDGKEYGGWQRQPSKPNIQGAIEDAIEEITGEKVNLIANTISKKLGFNRQLSQFEYAYVEKWYVDYGYALDIIEIALKRTTSKANPNFDYLDKLLSDWHDRNLHSAEEIQKFLLEFKQKNKNIKQLEKKTEYQKYDQRSYSNLNELYANKKN